MKSMDPNEHTDFLWVGTCFDQLSGTIHVQKHRDIAAKWVKRRGSAAIHTVLTEPAEYVYLDPHEPQCKTDVSSGWSMMKPDLNLRTDLLLTQDGPRPRPALNLESDH